MRQEREQAAAPTTAPKNTAKVSYHTSPLWSKSDQLVLGELILLCLSGNFNNHEQLVGYACVDWLLRYKLEHGLKGGEQA